MLLPLSCLFSFCVISNFVIGCFSFLCRTEQDIKGIFSCDPHGGPLFGNLVAVQGKVVDVICFKVSNFCKGFVAIFGTKQSIFGNKKNFIFPYTKRKMAICIGGSAIIAGCGTIQRVFILSVVILYFYSDMVFISLIGNITEKIISGLD